MTSNDETCPICDEKYNKNIRKQINCTGCNYHTCSKCIEKYFESSSVHPQCMQCHKIWNHQYLREKLGMACVKRINTNQKELLYIEQQALAPHTQEYIRLTRQTDSIHEELTKIYQKIQQLKEKIVDLNIQDNHNYRLIRRYIVGLSGGNLNGNISTNTDEGSTSGVQEYIKQCSENDCKGFVNKATQECDLCHTKYCLYCMEKKSEDHECNEDTLSTIRFLKQDSKKCPNCTTMIHLISGCPDMFCVHCKTAFNWNTLKINRNGNSNPHYYQWVQENNVNRNEDINPCDVTIHNVTRSLNFRKLTREVRENLMACIRCLDHTTRNIGMWKKPTGKLPRVYNGINNRYFHDEDEVPPSFAVKTLILRANYLQNNISNEQFKTGILKIHKADEFNSHIDDIKNAINTYKTDFMINLVFTQDDSEINYKNIYQEYVRFVVYMSSCVDHLNNVYYGSTSKKKEYSCVSILQSIPEIINRSQYAPNRGFLDVPDAVRKDCENYLELVKI